jgi:tripartite-type tricarboxylate transporter receptor subunit TctC
MKMRRDATHCGAHDSASAGVVLQQVLRFIRFVVVMATLLAGAAAQAAETYPSRPVRFIVHTTPGAASDLTARTMADELSKRLAQQFIVDNRGGAGGIVGADIVAKATPDGYTLLAGASSVMVMIPAISKRKLPFDPDVDLIPIGRITHSPGFVLVVNEKSPYRSVKDLIAAAKASPGKIKYGSAGLGTNPHMLGELLSDIGGVTMTHIPYRGPGPAQLDLLGGAIELQFDSAATVVPHIATGRLRGLIITDFERYPGLPAVPTGAEAGYPDLLLKGWTAMYAPGATPRAVVEKLRATFKDVMLTKPFHERLMKLDLAPGFLDGEELLVEQRKSRDFWRKFAAQRGIAL